jgi:cytochrome o ubiquinol oxidase subunit 3
MSDMTPAMRRRADEAASANRTMLGFWIYLMTDCVLFAALFATFAVMRGNTAGGPGGRELFDLPFVLLETVLLLVSSFTCGLAMLALQKQNKQLVVRLLVVTFILGAVFVGLEVTEFRMLAAEGNSWARSGFLSAYFTLVGTHGVHISIGLLWLGTLFSQLRKPGLSHTMVKRLSLFSLFWHFLDVIWIFIFSVVYLWGHIL